MSAKAKISMADLLAAIPGPKTRQWPNGEPFAEGLHHGSMSVELFAPRGKDTQQPHAQDELYIIVKGTSEFIHNNETITLSDGDVLFVPAGDKHHFENMSDDFATWVIFWGPKGGER